MADQHSLITPPPNLKEKALEILRSMQIDPVVIDGINVNASAMVKYDTIRRALEALPEWST